MISPVLITLFLPSFAEAAKKKQTFLQPLGPSANLKEYAPLSWYLRTDTILEFTKIQPIDDQIPAGDELLSTYRCYTFTKSTKNKAITSPISAPRSCPTEDVDDAVYTIGLEPKGEDAATVVAKDSASKRAAYVRVETNAAGHCYVKHVFTEPVHEARGLASVLMATALKVFRENENPPAYLLNASFINYKKKVEREGVWDPKHCGSFTAGTRAYVSGFQLAGYNLLANGASGDRISLDAYRTEIDAHLALCRADQQDWYANYNDRFYKMNAFVR